MKITTIRKYARALEVPVHYLGCFENLPEETLGQKIKKARLFMGLTKAEFAKVIGVTEKTIRNWERDVRTPSKSLSTLEEVLLVLKQITRHE